MSGVRVGVGRGLGGYQPGVYVPLKALFLVFSYFCSKHRLWVHFRTASLAVLTSTHNLCLGSKITKIGLL